jgi:multiple sugar transport system ATP-binding protein
MFQPGTFAFPVTRAMAEVLAFPRRALWQITVGTLTHKTMADLRINKLDKHYGSVHAVRGVDLEIPAGEFTVLVGQSGCGKSTLLRSIAGLEDISGGTIEIAGEVVNDLAPKDRDIAMVFQNYALYPYMKVYENIAFGLRARKTPKHEIEEKVQRAAKMLAIDHLLDRFPRQLSGGQLQRVAIGRAVVRNARLYLFDEPLSNLDAQLRDEMRGEIKRLHQELGKTMIYVTHDQIEAMTMADRIVLLRDGRIEQAGAPLELYERPATKYVAGFLGSPSMNFIPARLATQDTGLAVNLADGSSLALTANDTDRYGAYRDKDIILGVRPEHISRAADDTLRPGVVCHDVTIDLVQPTGSRTYATFLLGAVETVAELKAHDVSAPGENVKLAFDMNRVVLIDPASEQVL